MFQKKSLGQNFLKSTKVVADIVAAGTLAAGETVLEAGPGMGVLTEALLKTGAHVIAVEKDHRLIPELQQKFASEITSGQLTLIESDILDFEPSDYKLKPKSYKLVANIPYYITGQFIRKFLETGVQPSTMILLVQKEVAERVVARDPSTGRAGGKESILSISVKAYGTARYVETVKAGNFSPAPKVDSAILAITDISKKFFDGLTEEKFFIVVKAGFAHKRKKLSGNLKTLYRRVETALEKIGVRENARPENLSAEHWKNLARELV